MDDFSISLGATPDRLTVVCRGEFDLPIEEAFARAVGEACDGEQARIEIDLRDVTFFAVCGIGFLLRASEQARAQGRELEVAVNGKVRRVLDLAGIAERLPMR